MTYLARSNLAIQYYIDESSRQLDDDYYSCVFDVLSLLANGFNENFLNWLTPSKSKELTHKYFIPPIKLVHQIPRFLNCGLCRSNLETLSVFYSELIEILYELDETTENSNLLLPIEKFSKSALFPLDQLDQKKIETGCDFREALRPLNQTGRDELFNGVLNGVFCKIYEKIIIEKFFNLCPNWNGKTALDITSIFEIFDCAFSKTEYTPTLYANTDSAICIQTREALIQCGVDPTIFTSKRCCDPEAADNMFKQILEQYENEKKEAASHLCSGASLT